MFRFVFCLSILLAGFLGLSRGLAYWQDKSVVKISIEEVAHNPRLKDSHPQIFNIKGTVTLPPQVTDKDNLAVIVYSKSDSGGKIQLQMGGSDADGTREPKTGIPEFGNTNTGNWTITQIWLGTKEIADPSYTVYAVVVKAFNDADGKRLIRLTNNEFTTIKSVLTALQQGGFQPLAWTNKEEVTR